MTERGTSGRPTPKTLALGVLGALLAVGVAIWAVQGRRSRDPGARLLATMTAALDSAHPEGGLTIAYPLEGTLFPADIVAPTFRWHDDTPGVDAWVVSADLGDGRPPVTSLCDGCSWRPDAASWAAMKEASQGDGAELVVRVAGARRADGGHLLSGGRVTVRTSEDEVGDPIFFRDVPLPFGYAIAHLDTIRWRLGYVSEDGEARVVLDRLEVCANCHSFSADGSTLGMDVDYANDKGSYIVTPLTEETRLTRENIFTWSELRRQDGEPTFGLLSQVSPDGRYVVSTVKDASVFEPVDDDLYFSQLFFPFKGILGVYDRKTGRFSTLPGADDPGYVQSSPCWSPDGETVYFARAEALDTSAYASVNAARAAYSEAFLAGRMPPFRFEVYRVPFNGGRGGEARPVQGASGNGMSNFFPRISPDGRWLVFTMAKSYMLLQPDSQLYILPVGGGTPRRMTCNTDRMNSYHCFSPNGRWLVFSSKVNGPYTQLLLTHVDEEGDDTPPVHLSHLLPPERAANIPEFVRRPGGGYFRLTEAFMDDYNYERQGTSAFFKHQDVERAIDCFRRAVELNPKNRFARRSLVILLKHQDRRDELLRLLEAAVELDPRDVAARFDLARAYLEYGPQRAVREQADAILAIDPTEAGAHLLRGESLMRQKAFAEAREAFESALEVEPEGPYGLAGVARCFNAAGDTDAALVLFGAARDKLAEADGSDWFDRRAARVLARVRGFRAGVVTDVEGWLARAEVNEDILRIYALLSDLYEDAGEPGKAKAVRAQAQKLGLESKHIVTASD